MSDEGSGGSKRHLREILTAVLVALLAGGTSPWWWGEITGRDGGDLEDPAPVVDSGGRDPGEDPPLGENPPRCDDPWGWNEGLQRCTRTVRMARKAFSIPLEGRVDRLSGRIDLYLNRERRPDAGRTANYRANDGALQAVIPIMSGTTMVGVQREVIYQSRSAPICRVEGLPETTGHLRAMRVAYSLLLPEDCAGSGICEATLVDPGRARVLLGPLRIVIGPTCPGLP